MKSWYGSRAWKHLRRQAFIRDGYRCRMCGIICHGRGNDQRAPVADHIVPHRGDRRLFFDPENIQTLCKKCHDRHKQRMEKSGVVVGCDEHGIPLDPSLRASWIEGVKGSNG